MQGAGAARGNWHVCVYPAAIHSSGAAVLRCGSGLEGSHLSVAAVWWLRGGHGLTDSSSAPGVRCYAGSGDEGLLARICFINERITWGRGDMTLPFLLHCQARCMSSSFFPVNGDAAMLCSQAVAAGAGYLCFKYMRKGAASAFQGRRWYAEPQQPRLSAVTAFWFGSFYNIDGSCCVAPKCCCPACFLHYELCL